MKNFPDHYSEIQQLISALGEELPGPMAGFAQLHKASTTEGVLSTKTKELAALGMAITVRCDGCITYHVHDALEAGAVREEILEIIGVAIMMGGGPAVIYGIEAYEALNQFTESVAS